MHSYHIAHVAYRADDVDLAFSWARALPCYRAQVQRILENAARHGTFVPYTNTEQDVIESVFAALPSAEGSAGLTSHLVAPRLPAGHVHTRRIACREADDGVNASILTCDLHGRNRTVLQVPRYRLACCPQSFRWPAGEPLACRANGKGIVSPHSPMSAQKGATQKTKWAWPRACDESCE